MRPDELQKMVEDSGQRRLQGRTCVKLAVMSQAFLIAIEEARAKSPIATVDFATVIRVAHRLGVKLTYQDINARALWPQTLRLVLFRKRIGRMDGRVVIVVERVLVDGGSTAILRALMLATKETGQVIDARACTSDLVAQQAAMTALLRPFESESEWLVNRGVTILDATSGFPVDQHPLRRLAEHVEVIARVLPNDTSPRPRDAGARPALRETIAGVVHRSSDGFVEVGGPGEHHEIAAFAGGFPWVPVLCRTKVPSRPGGFASAGRKKRAQVLGEHAGWLSQRRYDVDRRVAGHFTARQTPIALENLELLVACDLACR